MTTDLASVEASTPVREAARMMRDRAIGDVLVTRDGKLTGIVTDRDLVVRCLSQDGQSAGMAVGDCTTSGEPKSLSPDDDVTEAMQLMQEHAIRRVPVLENGKAVGIVSLGDLALDRDRRSALGEISAAPPNN